MLTKQACFTLTALALAISPIAYADYANGPNPYDPHDPGGLFTPTGQGGFATYGSTPPSDDLSVGFNVPSVGGSSGTIVDPRPHVLGTSPDHGAGPALSWGTWNRGDAGSIWAEWDTFAHPGNNSAPAEGMSGTTSAELGWLPFTFRAGSGNLYAFTSHSYYTIDIDVSDLTGLNNVALQVEQFAPLEAKWNTEHNTYLVDDVLWNMSLDGGAAMDRDVLEHTFAVADWPTSFGDVDLFTGILLWNNVDLTGVSNLRIDFDNPVHTSLAQVAVDIGVVPLPAAVWLFGSGLLGLVAIARRKKA